MNVLETLKILAEQIEIVFPKMSDVVSGTADEKKLQRSIIADIQSRLAEIYGIIQREISNDDLNLEYDEAIRKYPERMTSILNLISTVALAAKTKLNIETFQKLFNKLHIQRMDAVCLECYQLKSTLTGTPDSNIVNIYSRGVTSRLEYEDYQTGFSKSISPGFVPGQLSMPFIGTPEILSRYLSIIEKAKAQLDPMAKVPKLEDRVLFSFSSNPEAPLAAQVKIEQSPKSLFQISAQYLLNDRAKFFKGLARLPKDVTAKVPELDVDYKHKFSLKVRKVLDGINFKPDAKEEKYLNQLSEALNNKEPYNAIHLIVQELDKANKIAYLSIFKDHMQPIRDSIVKLMKEYMAGKQEYVSHFGKPL